MLILPPITVGLLETSSWRRCEAASLRGASEICRARVPVTSASSSSSNVDRTVVMNAHTWPAGDRRSIALQAPRPRADAQAFCAFTELAQHRSQLKANLESLLHRARLLGSDLRTSSACSNQLRASESADRAAAFLPPAGDSVRPFPSAHPGRRDGRAVRPARQAVGVELLHCIHDARVNFAAAFVQHPAVGDVVGEGMLECVLQIRKELCRVQKFSSLEIVENTPKPRPPSARKLHATG